MHKDPASVFYTLLTFLWLTSSVSKMPTLTLDQEETHQVQSKALDLMVFGSLIKTTQGDLISNPRLLTGTFGYEDTYCLW